MTKNSNTVEDSPLLFPYSVHGEPCNKILVLVAGFPDDNISAFGQENIDHFSKFYYVISLCLPGYAKHAGRRWGYDFDELVKMMNDTIEYALVSASIPATTSSSKIYLIGHDWGAYLAQLYENKYPEKINKMCLLDVAVSKDLPSSIGQYYIHIIQNPIYLVNFLLTF